MVNEEPELRQLKEIRQELKAIKGNTANSNWFFNGVLYGAGWIVGSLVAIILIGWVLTVMGVIPGFGNIAQDIQAAFTRVGR